MDTSSRARRMLNQPVPTVTVFAINNGAASSATRTVTLNHGRVGDVRRCRVAPVLCGAVLSVQSGDGDEAGCLQLRNAADALSVVRSDTIVLFQ